LAGDEGVFLVGISEITIRLDGTGMVPKIMTGSALSTGWHPATTIISRAVFVPCAGRKTLVTRVGRVFVAVVADFITFLVWVAVCAPHPVAATSD
jgi:hypothetical protein